MAAARLIAPALALSLSLVAACDSSSPTRPSTDTPAVPSATYPNGSWTGVFEITSCAGASSCRSNPEKFALRLAPDGSGVLQIDTQIWSEAPPIAVDVIALELPDRTTTLTGATTVGRPADVQLTLSAPIANVLTGTVRYSVLGTGGPVTRDGRILFANRDATVAFGRFHGTWAGFVNRTECTGDCSEYDPVLTSGAVWLELSQAGSSLVGRFNREEMTGSVAGDTFAATSHTELRPEQCRPGWDEGTTCLIDLTVTAGTDALDRMHGSISYRVEAVTYNNRRYAFSARADLTGIARWP